MSLRLIDRVGISGRSFLGSGARLVLQPMQSGRYWQVNGQLVELTPQMLRMGWFHHMVLEHGDARMRITEHFLPIVARGVYGFRAIMETRGLPYDGCSNLIWNAIREKLQQDAPNTFYEPPFETLSSTPRKLRKGVERRITYQRTGKPNLIIRVLMDYGPHQRSDEIYVLPADWDLILSARHRGRRSLYPLARVASMLGWQHLDKIAWEQRIELKALLREESRHRALDIVGDLALNVPEGMQLGGLIVSTNAGHFDDEDLNQKWAAKKRQAIE